VRRLDAVLAQEGPAVERSILIADLGDLDPEAPLQPLRDDVAMAPALAGLDVCRALPAHQHRHPPLAGEVAEISGDIDVVEFGSLLMDFAEEQGATAILRGLRAVADFEYEFQMAGMNQQLNDDIETVFLMADVSLQPIASKLVKEIARFGGSIDKFVTPAVAQDVRRHLNGGSR